MFEKAGGGLRRRWGTAIWEEIRRRKFCCFLFSRMVAVFQQISSSFIAPDRAKAKIYTVVGLSTKNTTEFTN